MLWICSSLNLLYLAQVNVGYIFSLLVVCLANSRSPTNVTSCCYLCCYISTPPTVPGRRRRIEREATGEFKVKVFSGAAMSHISWLRMNFLFFANPNLPTTLLIKAEALSRSILTEGLVSGYPHTSPVPEKCRNYVPVPSNSHITLNVYYQRL